MACETDAYTKRPRTPNDPYTLMTDEQIQNIAHVCEAAPNIVEDTILLTPPTSGPIACNQLKLAPPGRWRETLHVYSVVVCVDNRS